MFKHDNVRARQERLKIEMFRKIHLGKSPFPGAHGTRA